MVGTFFNYQAGTPEQTNPWNRAFQNALSNYGAVQDIQKKKMLMQQYPQMLQAEMFAKEISPLAALASSPNFTGFNPQIQKMIAQRIGGYLGGQGQAPSMQEEASTPPGYASGEDIYNRLSHGATATFGPGAATATAKSRLAGAAEQFGLSPKISQALGGSKLAGESAGYDQALEEGVRNLTLKGYSEPQARDLLKRKPGESDKAYSNRIKPLFIEAKQASHPSSSKGRKIVNEEGEDVSQYASVAQRFNTTPDKIKLAIEIGVPNDADSLRQWLQETQ